MFGVGRGCPVTTIFPLPPVPTSLCLDDVDMSGYDPVEALEDPRCHAEPTTPVWNYSHTSPKSVQLTPVLRNVRLLLIQVCLTNLRALVQSRLPDGHLPVTRSRTLRLESDGLRTPVTTGNMSLTLLRGLLMQMWTTLPLLHLSIVLQISMLIDDRFSSLRRVLVLEKVLA